MNPRTLQICAALALAGCATSTSRPTALDDANQRPVPEMRDLDGGLSMADQSIAPEDVELRETIRTALLADPYLSTTAKAVNIVSSDKHVTLRGLVTTENERTRVVGYATQIAGAGQVDDVLQVPPAP